jgi:transporter family-2 protein
MSFCVGTVALIVFTFVFANQSTHLGALKHLPLYMLLGGGLLGAFYVTMALILAPRIGIASVMALGIAGQLVAALLLDRFGMFGLLERGLTTGRVGGVVLVFAGALMVRLL